MIVELVGLLEQKKIHLQMFQSYLQRTKNGLTKSTLDDNKVWNDATCEDKLEKSATVLFTTGRWTDSQK